MFHPKVIFRIIGMLLFIEAAFLLAGIGVTNKIMMFPFGTDGISARDVARHLNVSQSLLRLRFRTINGKSIRDEILDARFKAINKLLETTQYSLDHIAAKTGFSSAAFLSHAYSKRFGIAPSKSRKPKSSPQNRKT